MTSLQSSLPPAQPGPQWVHTAIAALKRRHGRRMAEHARHQPVVESAKYRRKISSRKPVEIVWMHVTQSVTTATGHGGSVKPATLALASADLPVFLSPLETWKTGALKKVYGLFSKNAIKRSSLSRSSRRSMRLRASSSPSSDPSTRSTRKAKMEKPPRSVFSRRRTLTAPVFFGTAKIIENKQLDSKAQPF